MILLPPKLSGKMRALYSGSGPKADQGYLTITDVMATVPEQTPWPPENHPIPAFWTYCQQKKALTGAVPNGNQADIWHWSDLQGPPQLLLQGPARQAWYFPSLSPDGSKLALVATPDRFFPRLYNHPAQLLVFQRQAGNQWHRLGLPVPCLIESIVWDGDDKILHQDRHGRLVRSHITRDGIVEDGVFVHKRASNPCLQPTNGIIAARYGSHLHLIAGDDQAMLALGGTVCDHGWAGDQKLFAVIDDGFWHCQLVWFDLGDWPKGSDLSGLKPEKGAISFARLDQMVIL